MVDIEGVREGSQRVRSDIDIVFIKFFKKKKNYRQNDGLGVLYWS